MSQPPHGGSPEEPSDRGGPHGAEEQDSAPDPSGPPSEPPEAPSAHPQPGAEGPHSAPPSGPQSPYSADAPGPPGSGPQYPAWSQPPGPQGQGPYGPPAPELAQPSYGSGPQPPHGPPPYGPDAPGYGAPAGPGAPGGPPGAYGPQPQYAAPGGPGGPYGPYGPPANPYHDPYGPARPRRTGLFIGIGAGAVVVLLLIVGGVALVLSGGSAHDVAPQCAELEGEVLAEHVPDPELTRDEFTEQQFWDELRCEWRTGGGTTAVPGYASVLLMRNDGTDPVGTTAEDLERDIQGHSTTPVEGVGDEAHSWYNETGQEGCVAARTDNVYLRVCHDAQQDFLNVQSIDPDEAVDGATRLASDFVATIEQRL